ncbi:MAG: hypothetical protein GY757_41130, partial [bacterium]|nr:hypothetical protein [bacterium]
EAAGPAGDLLYRWGNPLAYERGTRADQQLFVPHDGRWIEDDCPGAGNILIFNNGTQRPMENYTSGRCRPLMSNYSTVDQLIPPENGIGGYNLDASNAYGPSAPNWTYIASPSSDFYASHISGAQRLPDGNTLICNGTAGTFFEVTADGETVWEYVSPYSASTQVGNSVFRAVHYSLLLEN